MLEPTFCGERSGPFTDERSGPRLAELRRRLPELAAVAVPGSGQTRSRFRVLADAGRADASLGRLLEGHVDALAIRAELSAPARADCLQGVWAARPGELRAIRTAHGWQLRGVKPWCSGGAALDRALLTALDNDGQSRLFDVEVAQLALRDDWHPIGMRASDSCTADVDVVVGDDDELGGAPDAYVERPGFGHGGVGVAAVWFGIADRLGADLAARVAIDPDPYRGAAAGEASALLAAAASILAVAADQIDGTPDDRDAAVRRAATVRAAVGSLARRVTELVVAADGATTLAFDRHHARAVADLVVYLGQLHHGHDAAGVRRDGTFDL